MEKNILITGVTGNLGALMACKFLENGHRVIATVRSRSKNNFHIERALQAINVFASDNNLINESIKNGKFIIIRGDMNDIDSLEEVKQLKNIDETWHFASSLKYMPKDREQIYQANVIGLKNILKVHYTVAKPKAPFLYISTAFIGGKNTDLLDENQIKLDEEMTFTNEYERTKLIAENIVLDEISKNSLNALIFRPSIVVGDSIQGKLINYNGFYLGVKALFNFMSYLRDINNVNLNIRLSVPIESTVNLIPLDNCIDSMLFIYNSNKRNNTIYSIVNTEILSTRQVLKVIADAVGLNITFASPEEFGLEPRTKLEKILLYGMNYIMPYTNRNIVFDCSNTTSVLGKEPNYHLLENGKIKMLVKKYIEILSKNK